MADIIKYLRIPFPRFPLVKDASDDWNPVRGDYNGGVFAGPFGGFHDTWRVDVTATSSGGGTTELTTGELADGYLYVLQQCSLSHDDVAERDTYLMVYNTVTLWWIIREPALAPTRTLNLSGPLVLKAGDEIRARCLSLASGKKLYLFLAGYKVRL